jgi:adenylate cyclase
MTPGDQAVPSEPDLSLKSASGGHSSLSETAVRKQLRRILAIPEFQRSPMLRDFLNFIVGKTLAGQAREIKAYTVAIQVLGRRADFDAGKDPIVRILAGRLRRVLERYYLTQGRQDPVRIDIPKGAYVPRFQEIRRDEPSSAADPVLARPAGPAVAVMPLLNLTGDRQQEFFTDGLAEELTSELARYQDLKVIAYQSTLHWKGKGHDVREVGRDLGVRFLVEGSVRKAAKTVKIAIHLIDALNGQSLWGEQYCRELKADTLIALQEEIARQVVARMGDLYGVIPQTLSRESRKKPPEALETYEAILRFYHHITIMSPQTFAESLMALEQAVDRDPESGLAWSLLAFLCTESYSLQLGPMDSPLERAWLAAHKGTVQEPENQVVRAAQAHVHFFRNERELFLSEAEAALALNPNAPVPIAFLGWLLALYGEWERGLAILKKGMELNPHYPGWLHMAPFFNLYLQERYEEADQEARAFQMPQLFWDPLLRAAALGKLGKKPEANLAVQELLRLRPNFVTDGHFLMSCYVKFPRLFDALLDGLRQAGLKL